MTDDQAQALAMETCKQVAGETGACLVAMATTGDSAVGATYGEESSLLSVFLALANELRERMDIPLDDFLALMKDAAVVP